MVQGQGFDFLGYRFEAGTRWVRRKSIQRFRDRIREKTKRMCGKAIEKVIEELNPILRGWYYYFRDVTKYTLGDFDSFVRRRLRAIIERQNKRKSFGAGLCNKRIPNKFFARKCLFNMEDLQRQYFSVLVPMRNNRLESRMRRHSARTVRREGWPKGHSYPYLFLSIEK